MLARKQYGGLSVSYNEVHKRPARFLNYVRSKQ